MKQLVLNIEDESILDKLLIVLKDFENSGVSIDSKSKTINNDKLTKEYMKENWRSLVMTNQDSSNYYKSEQYFIDRAIDYEERGKI